MPSLKFSKGLVALCLAILVCFSFGVSPGAAFELSWRSFSTADGLPSNRIIAITQTEDDTLWVGTEGGLRFYFNGKFHEEELMPGDVSLSRIQALLSAPGNTLWVATDSGLHRRNADGIWDQHLEGEAGLQTPNITALLIRKDGAVWVGAKDGLAWWDGASWHLEYIGGEAPRINALVEDDLGRLWVIGPSKIQILQEGSLVETIDSSDGLPEGAELKTIVLDTDSLPWVGTAQGLTGFRELGVDRILDQSDGLGNGEVWSLLKDPDGLWVGTSTGLAFLADGTVERFYTKSDGLAGEVVLALARDSEGNLWAGTDQGLTRLPIGQWSIDPDPLLDQASISALLTTQSDGGFLAVSGGLAYRLTGGDWSLAELDPPTQSIFALARDNEGNIWAGSDAGLLAFDGEGLVPDQRLPSTYFVNALLVDQNGLLWAGTDHGLCYLTDQKALCYKHPSGGGGQDIILSLWETEAGDLWLGTLNRGAVRLRQGKFLQFTRSSTEDGLVDDIVLAGLEDSSGNIWFGTSLGLSRLESGTDPTDPASWISFTEPRIASNRVNALWEDLRPNHIWVGTDRGLSLIYNDQASVFTQSDGLSENWINALGQDQDGILWIGTESGLTTHHDLGTPPQVVWPDLSDGNKSCGLDCSKLEVAYDVGNVAVSPLVSDLGDLEGVWYSFVLSPAPALPGLPEWASISEIGYFENIRQPRLFGPPVQYAITLIAHDRDFNYSEHSEPKLLVVNPPSVWDFLGDRPWLLVTVIVLFASLLALAIYSLIRFIQRRKLFSYNIQLEVELVKPNYEQNYSVKWKAHEKQRFLGVQTLDGESPLNQQKILQAGKLAKEIQQNPGVLKDTISKLGIDLCEALFPAEEDRAQLRNFGVGKKDVRLQIHLPSDSQVRGLPWEFIQFSPESDAPIDTNLMMVRAQKPAREPVQLTELKVLAAWANQNPRYGQLTRLEYEVEQIRQAASAAGKLAVTVDQLPDTTWQSFQDKVNTGKYNVIHFSGHGGINRQENVLFFRGTDGNPHPIIQERLVQTFHSLQADEEKAPLCLVVLNACQSAWDLEGIRGIAESLVQEANVLAVIGMGYKITEESAVDFMRDFYRIFFQHGQVDYAVREGRKTLLDRKGKQFRDWGVPRLYTCVEEGQVFKRI